LHFAIPGVVEHDGIIELATGGGNYMSLLCQQVLKKYTFGWCSQACFVI
jgi:hypothetical protein